jgi:hypothetical protein
MIVVIIIKVAQNIMTNLSVIYRHLILSSINCEPSLSIVSFVELMLVVN